MHHEFEAEYAKLNEQQRKAVDNIEGPLLVLAGPGTGKTQLLSLRVANILRKTDTKPANILCLTYTNKAAINMKQRIIKLAGAEATKLPVKTFHSFASEVMNIYPDYFWNAAKLSVAPDSVQLEVIESIVKSLPLDNPLALKFAGQYTLLYDIRQAIGLAKDAGLTPTKLKSILEVNLAYLDEIEQPLIDILDERLSYKKLSELQTKISKLPIQPIDEYVYPLTSLSTVIIQSLDEAIKLDDGTDKTTNTGDWKKHWIQTEAGQKGMFIERRRNDWWLELSNIYENYLTRMHERGFYDYSDMIVEVIGALEQNPDILAELQERYNYVLIDEFQDTNLAQLRLAHLISDHHYANGQPNLMVVGDDDQTIYKFSGAELNNMLSFRKRYTSAEIIVLTKNYRSTQAVLDAAKTVIEQADNRLVKQDSTLTKDLIATIPISAKNRLRAYTYASRELQFSEIARDIKKNYTKEKSIAVLARNHESLIKIANILQQLNVPIRYERQTNILDHEIINQIYLLTELLLAIQNGHQDKSNELAHEVIRHPMWGISPTQLWQLALDNYTKSNWLESLLNSKIITIKNTGEWLLWLSQDSTTQPLSITLEHLLGLRSKDDFTSPINSYYIEGKDKQISEYLHGLSAIQLLRSQVHDFAKTSEPSLNDLVRYIEINKDNKIIIADESPFVTGEDAVQLLTVYKAKGLEFDDVYIIDAVEDNWQPRAGTRRPPANLPLQPAGDDLDDYVRLMYVAMTRARYNLTISSYYLNHVGKEVATSPIIQSSFDIKNVTEENEAKLVQVLTENLRWPSLDGGQEKAMLKAKLENYVLNVTHLLNFLDVEKGGPQYFKERNLLRLPQVKTTSMAYGTAIHSALETAQVLTNNGSNSTRKVNEDFTKALLAEQIPAGEIKRYDAKGKQTLSRLFNEYSYQFIKGNTPEQKLSDIRLGSAVLSGKLDRIDKSEDGIVIVDYKTGRPLSSFDTKNKTESLKAHKHKMQLIFYSLLAQEHPSYSQFQSISGQMVYVDAEDKRHLVKTYTPTQEDKLRLKQLIEAVYARITNLDLPDVKSYTQDLDGMIKFENDLLAK